MLFKVQITLQEAVMKEFSSGNRSNCLCCCRLPTQSSTLYANNITKFLLSIGSQDHFHVNLSDEVRYELPFWGLMNTFTYGSSLDCFMQLYGHFFSSSATLFRVFVFSRNQSTCLKSCLLRWFARRVIGFRPR